MIYGGDLYIYIFVVNEIRIQLCCIPIMSTNFCRHYNVFFFPLACLQNAHPTPVNLHEVIYHVL